MPPILRGSVTHSAGAALAPPARERLTLSASMSRDVDRSMTDVEEPANQTGVPQAARENRLEAKTLLLEKKRGEKKKVGELSRVPNSPAAASPPLPPNHHPLGCCQD